MKRDNHKKDFADRVDDFIGIFSPLEAAKRRYFRFISKQMLGTAYRGAEYGRLRGSSWIPGGGSADQDLLPDLAILRERSRDLVRNDGIASGAVNTIIINVIGSGIKPQSRIDKETLKINEDYADQLQKQIERVWERWSPIADAGNRMNFYEIEELSERSRFVNGESIILPVRKNDKNRPYSLALQLIESDRLQTPGGMTISKNIRYGVEVGEQYGEPIAYHIRKTHPGDLYFKASSYGYGTDAYIRYPAINELGQQNIYHLYHVKRSGQTRGEPFFAAVLNLFKDRYEYMEAELVAARVAACFAIFIKKENAYQASLARSEKDSNGKQIEEMSPAMIEYLAPGEDITAFNPNRPGGTFGMFIERVLRDISSGLNIPYEILAKDFSKSNYSNTRAALLEARRYFKMQQRFIADKLCQPILELLLEEAYLKGELPILDFYQNKAAYVRSRWMAPGWEWVDPKNEVDSAVQAVDNNLSTLAEEAASQGQDWEDNLEQRARELRKIKDLEEKNGIKLTPDMKPAVAAGNNKNNADESDPAKEDINGQPPGDQQGKEEQK